MRNSLFPPRSESPGAIARLVRVAIERGLDAPDGLTYAAAGGLADVAVGERVMVPLGRRDARAAGFVVEVDVEPDVDPDRIKPIARRTGARLPAALVELARWMARYYCCPLGMVLASMVPAAVKHARGEVVRIEIEPTGASPDERLPPETARVWERIVASPPDRWPLPPRDLLAHTGARTLAPINRLVRAGLLREVERRRVRADEPQHLLEPDRELTLSDEQTSIVDTVAASLGGFGVHLVRGVTGSGKTEVYLRIIERVLARGECAIVLVPEISLTPQTVGRFVGRFKDGAVAVLHSGLTMAQRNRQWSLVGSGTARVVVGARSAVFAPYDAALGARVGLIVVDEEHDGAYKQDQLPRYHGRDVAIKRAQLEECPVVLGSATPSLESWMNAQRGRYALHELSMRAGGASMPRVEVVDFVAERRSRPWQEHRVSLIGPRLESAIGQTLSGGGQCILMLNRRGYANYICCPDHRCGWTMRCDRCDATMVYHRDRRLPLGGFVRCHHCLAEQRLPEQCPDCGKRVNTFGMGTQRVEEELSLRFPELVEGATMLRLDGDTVHSGRAWRDVLERFGREEVRVLVGTQMIAKGLDFPAVRLVGIINADTALNLPDFRAAERTFQLVSQVAGRAGRAAGAPGRVIVQTFEPETPAVRFAAAHDYPGFAAAETATRELAGLPPFARMARVVCRDKDHPKALESARRIAESLRAHAGGAVLIRGPMPCPISRVNGQHRVAIELIADNATPLQRALTGARADGLLKSDAHTAVDVDPVALL